MPQGLGFDAQSKRFGAQSAHDELPGPGTYVTRKDSDWITLPGRLKQAKRLSPRTHNIYFGDL